jgi:hypothetical protein
MAEAEAKVSVRRAWPWGLAVVTDPASSEPVPEELDEHGIAAGRTVLVSAILHETDGEATAEIWVSAGPPGLICVYDAEFFTSSGAVTLGDAGQERHTPAEIGKGSHRLRVLVDAIGSPERIVFEFGTVGG